mmetsp:Transcript_59451/g.156490  ORF Transcript_59451/g.156490 Transcript_59451/m.156490 type:complete len:314 (-) Transcript_59451:247-1188(-)
MPAGTAGGIEFCDVMFSCVYLITLRSFTASIRVSIGSGQPVGGHWSVPTMCLPLPMQHCVLASGPVLFAVRGCQLPLLLCLRPASWDEGLDGEFVRLPDPQEHLHEVVLVRSIDHRHVAEAHGLASVRDLPCPQHLPWVGDVAVHLRARLVQNRPVLLVNPLHQIQIHDLLKVQKALQDLVRLARRIHLHSVQVAPVQNGTADGLELQLLLVAVDLDDEHLGCVLLRKRDEILATAADPSAHDVQEERPRLLHAVHRRVVGDEMVHRRVGRRQRHGDGMSRCSLKPAGVAGTGTATRTRSSFRIRPKPWRRAC